MDKNLKVSKSIEINAPSQKVWEVLTNPEHIKMYLFGTTTTTDWQEGSPILFEGEYNGTVYQDKGNVLKNIPYSLLQYNYWSSFSGVEDKEENYFVVSYKIEQKKDKKIEFSWLQEGFATPEAMEHANNSLQAILEQIKKIAENPD